MRLRTCIKWFSIAKALDVKPFQYIVAQPPPPVAHSQVRFLWKQLLDTHVDVHVVKTLDAIRP